MYKSTSLYRFFKAAVLISMAGVAAHVSAQEWTGVDYNIVDQQEVIKLKFSEDVLPPKITQLDQGAPRVVLDWADLSAHNLGHDIGLGQRALAAQGPVNRFRFARRGASGLRLVMELEPNARFDGLQDLGEIINLTFKGRQIVQPAALEAPPVKFDPFVYDTPIPRLKPSLSVSAAPQTPSVAAAPKLEKNVSLDIHSPSKRVFSKNEAPYPRVAPHIGAGHGFAPQTRGIIAPPPRKPVIVIDPGHGGYDPGAIGVKGTKEKLITSAVTVRLAKVLRDSGRYEVVLTRTKDVYVEHEDRLRIARERGADLFISLHADATENGKAAGASVYTLADRAKGRSQNITHTQNWILDVDLSEQTASVGNILVDLAQRKTLSHSSQFAARLVEELENKVPLVRNTHRRAGFYVLLAPDVPAVLLELGFLSNASDEQRLLKSSEQEKIVKATVRAINGFFDAKKP